MSVPVSDLEYRCPSDLSVTKTPLRRVVVVGQCLMAAWPEIIEGSADGCPCDLVLFNRVQRLSPSPPHPVDEYDFQLVQIPMRSLVSETEYFRLSYNDVGAYERLLEEAKDRLSGFLEAALRWNLDHGLLTFVFNFIVPQQNPLGRLIPRYDLRNFAFFVEKLNEALSAELEQYNNAYFFDFDQILSTFGRRNFQDDVLWQFNHNSALSNLDCELDVNRIETAGAARDYYPVKTEQYLQYAWQELVGMHRTITRADAVKLVVIDLDDTLWRGIAAERAEGVVSEREGWPLGIVEALGYLKRRGVLLAIVSKNDEALIKQYWNALVGSQHLSLDDFAVVRINWLPKAENMEEIFRVTNLLPRSTVFVDDNPVERAAVKAAFPDVRLLGQTPLLWRRILLWSAETQVPSITAESSVRTEMVRAQGAREAQRGRLSREEFLQSLNLNVEIEELHAITHSGFPRALELLNKTNQYNTTGKRWAQAECAAAFERGTRFFIFSAADKFTEYGIVGVVIVDGAEISQFVMSCRVVGMEVEQAVLAHIVDAIHTENGVVARLQETDFNTPARSIYADAGFVFADNVWRRPAEPAIAPPGHIGLRAALR